MTKTRVRKNTRRKRTRIAVPYSSRVKGKRRKQTNTSRRKKTLRGGFLKNSILYGREKKSSMPRPRPVEDAKNKGLLTEKILEPPLLNNWDNFVRAAIETQLQDSEERLTAQFKEGQPKKGNITTNQKKNKQLIMRLWAKFCEIEDNRRDLTTLRQKHLANKNTVRSSPLTVAFEIMKDFASASVAADPIAVAAEPVTANTAPAATSAELSVVVPAPTVVGPANTAAAESEKKEVKVRNDENYIQDSYKIEDISPEISSIKKQTIEKMITDAVARGVERVLNQYNLPPVINQVG